MAFQCSSRELQLTPQRSCSLMQDAGRRPRQHALCLSMFSSNVDSPRISNLSELSDELVDLVLKQRRQGSLSTEQSDRVRSLVDRLVAANVSFDPKISLHGPLFVSTVVEGPRPLWEKIRLPFFSSLQGQQYTYTDSERSVINYAEILGSALHLRAYGTYEPSQDRDEDDAERSNSVETSSASFAKQTVVGNSSPLEGLLAMFKSPFMKEQPGSDPKALTATLLQCPADFTVTVNKASIFVFGNPISVPISGVGYLRVLYANDYLRIFVSKTSTFALSFVLSWAVLASNAALLLFF